MKELIEIYILKRKWLFLLTAVTVPPSLYLWSPFGRTVLELVFG